MLTIDIKPSLLKEIDIYFFKVIKEPLLLFPFPLSPSLHGSKSQLN